MFFKQTWIPSVHIALPFASERGGFIYLLKDLFMYFRSIAQLNLTAYSQWIPARWQLRHITLRKTA